MKKLLSLLLTLPLVLLPAFGQKRQNPKSQPAQPIKETAPPVTPPTSIREDAPSEEILLSDLPNKEIVVPVGEGDFVFKNLKINQNEVAYYLTGQVSNNTFTRWNHVTFKVILTDESGMVIPSYVAEQIAFYQIEKGETTDLVNKYTQYKLGQKIAPRTALKSNVKSLRISIFEGAYPITRTLSIAAPSASNDLKFADNLISLTFIILPNNPGIHFSLKNKTESPVEIDWAQVSYVDSDNKTHRVIHEGVRYMERDKTPAPTIVPPLAGIDDVLVPTDSIYYEGEWKTRPLFEDIGRISDFKPVSTFGVFLPLKINNTTKQYMFRFKSQILVKK